MRPVYEIGALRLDPDARVLTHAGEPVALGARAVAVLSALVSRAGEYVSKAEIIDFAWPGRVVEEANLAVQISAIRRVLAGVSGGDGWIETLARRGYRFAGPVTQVVGRASATAAAIDRKRTNLPQVLTSFVGREKEIAEIKRLLPTTRLLTLTGPGGIGKTRLALQCSSEILDAYRDGIWFVDLAPLVDSALVPGSVAQLFGVKESAGQSLLGTLCGYLRGRELLLVLDNCEHLLPACADLAEALVRDTARVSVIATSREALHVATERVFPVSELPLPDPKTDPGTIARADAARLFVDRARQHRSRFDLEETRAQAVAEICVRLDGNPLALELAAARVAVLPVEEIVRMLGQRFRLLTGGSRDDLPRQQTLRAMIDWSYELLDDAEQKLFARLSVFAGGWTIAAAKVVGEGEGIASDDVVYLLIALIEKSLVVADEDGDRYRMLETVREYARERLHGSGMEDAVRRRHRDHFLALAEEAEPKVSGAEQADWLQQLEVEHENLRASLDWSLGDAGTGGGLKLAGALQRFWQVRGHFSEGRRWVAALVTAGQDPRFSADRAKALNGSGCLAYFQGDYSAARELHEGSLALRRALGDRSGVAASLSNLGSVACDQGEYAAARELFDESLAIRRELGNRIGIATSVKNLGTVAYSLGDYKAARAHFEESLAIRRELGEWWGIASSLDSLGSVAFAQGDYADARALSQESLGIRRQLGDRSGIADCLGNLGGVAHALGDHAAAIELYRECLTILAELGDRGATALSLVGIASVIADLGGPLVAARLWGRAERLQEELGSVVSPTERQRYDRCIAAARTSSGDLSGFDRAWVEGRNMPLEQAMNLALKHAIEQH